MSYTIQYLDIALEDMAQIKTYLTEFHPSTWTHFRDEVERKIARLQDTPEMYETYFANPTYRRLVVKDYLVFYKVDSEQQIVRIYRILHGARDIQHFLTQ